MLLIDGVKYEEWVPPNEDALEQIVIEHAQDIFGEDSIYFDKKQKLSSLAGVGSIPDGLAIMFGGVPEWHIVEVELSSHDPYQHIVPQVDKFINAVENPQMRTKIIEALYDTVDNDELLKEKIRQAIGQGKDIHKFLSDLIAKLPTITIVVERVPDQLKEALKKYPQKKIVEFQTFMGVEADLLHAHLFGPAIKPIYKPVTTSSEAVQPLQSLENGFEAVLKPSYITQQYIHVPIAKKNLFPKNGVIELDTGSIVLQTKFCDYDKNGQWLQNNLDKWLNAEPKPKVRDRIRITVIEPMKKYRLEIVK